MSTVSVKRSRAYRPMVSIADPEEVDEALLQFCSSQLKLIQLYTDIQELHAGAEREASSDNVRARHARGTAC